MDLDWMRERLEEYSVLLNRYFGRTTTQGQFRVTDRAAGAVLERRRPTVIRILSTLDPALGRWPSLREFGASAVFHAEIERGLGILDDRDEWAVRLVPDAPQLRADRLHPWVWDAARSLWESGHFKEAVQAAAISVNARLQTKVGRRDLSESRLVGEAFSDNAAEPGRPRLRVPGDQAEQTVRSRQRGASMFGMGCFGLIRNPGAHEHLELTEQEALEQLAALSVFARVIDECQLEEAEPGADIDTEPDSHEDS